MRRRLERAAADVSGEVPPTRAEAATIKFIHFRLDSCNENLPEKCIHRNYASRPGGMPRRVFCCAHASRGRARRILVRQQRERRLEPCRFRRAKAEIRPAGRAGRAIGQRSCWKICWRPMPRRSGARRSSWRKRAISPPFACAWTGWRRRERTSRSFSTCRRSPPPPTASPPRRASWPRSRAANSRVGRRGPREVIDVYVGALEAYGFEERLTKLESAANR